MFNPLPNNKFLDVTKLKAIAVDKLTIAKMTIFLSLPAFSPFPTVFSKAFFFRVVKSRDYGKELNLTFSQTSP